MLRNSLDTVYPEHRDYPKILQRITAPNSGTWTAFQVSGVLRRGEKELPLGLLTRRQTVPHNPRLSPGRRYPCIHNRSVHVSTLASAHQILPCDTSVTSIKQNTSHADPVLQYQCGLAELGGFPSALLTSPTASFR